MNSRHLDEIRKNISSPALLEQFAEECAEAAFAALKLARIRRGENPTNAKEGLVEEMLFEEIRDLNNVLEVMGNPGINEKKIERWVKRIEGRMS